MLGVEGTLPRAAAARIPRRELGYQPALDGLRGLALLAIVAYHAGLRNVPGAFLSVLAAIEVADWLGPEIVRVINEPDAPPARS